METLLEALKGTPWWVYVLLGYLIFVGIQASKTRVVHLFILLILPILFTILSLETLLTAVKPDLFAISTWFGAIVIGSFLGWWEMSRWPVVTDKQRLLIRIPGNWSTLFFILLIFATKYYFSYQLAIDPNLVNQTWFEFSMLAVSGLCTGLFIGRFIRFLYCLRTGPHQNLEKS